MSENNIALEQIAAAVAHEVKNPLTLVHANLDIIESDDLNETHRAHYNMIRKELSKINEIMMDFIHISEPYAYSEDIVYLWDLAQDLSNSILTAHGNTVEMKISCDNRDINVKGNEKQLKILLNNIAKNALEAMNFKGCLLLEIFEEKELAVIKLTDSGNGIQENIRENIFNEYFTTKPNGSGLGLSICKKIAKNHGGSFHLETLAKGCAAIVKFPVYN